MDIDITGLTKSEIVEFQETLAKQLVERRRQEIEETAAQLRKIVAESEYSEDELLEAAFGIKSTAAPKYDRKKPRNPPKYRNPIDPEVTWTGRGKHPFWFKNALAGEGEFDRAYSEEELLISQD